MEKFQKFKKKSWERNKKKFQWTFLKNRPWDTQYWWVKSFKAIKEQNIFPLLNAFSEQQMWKFIPSKQCHSGMMKIGSDATKVNEKREN